MSAPAPKLDDAMSRCPSSSGCRGGGGDQGTNADWETEGEDCSTCTFPASRTSWCRQPPPPTANGGGRQRRAAGLAVAARRRCRDAGVSLGSVGEALAEMLLGSPSQAVACRSRFPSSCRHARLPVLPGPDGRAVHGEGLLIGHRW
jgi:hypothetical protein